MSLDALIKKFNRGRKSSRTAVIYCAKGEEATIRKQWDRIGVQLIVIEDGTPADRVEELLKMR